MTTAALASFSPCGGESWRDPFSMYRALRDHDPVHRVVPEDGARAYWVLSRFSEILPAAIDASTFSSADGLTFHYGEREQLSIEAPIVMMDPPEHTALRKLAIKRFTPQQVRALDPMIREFVVERIERLRDQGACHLVFAWPAFWWLEYYARFARYLRQRFPLVSETERIMVFALRQESTEPPLAGTNPVSAPR